MKRVAIIIIVLLLISTACGTKQKMEDKLTEKIIEQAIGADVDIDGDEVTISTEEGDYSIGSTEWPSTELSRKIPEFKKGKIASVMSSEAYLLILIEEVDEKDFMNYYDDVKGEFNKESYETKTNDTIAYVANNDEGIVVMISYNAGDDTVTISSNLPEND